MAASLCVDISAPGQMEEQKLLPPYTLPLGVFVIDGFHIE
jgi:hypothetical protein